MQRRTFLKASLAASTLPMVPRTLFADDSTDWSLVAQSINVDALAPASLSIEGTLPADLNGQLFRNGPARRERNGIRHRHWFDGDGMVQRFDFGDSSITHQARFVQTQKYRREQAAGRFLYSATGTVLADSEPLGNNDTANLANTSLLEWDSELLALWEGGSAHRIDPVTLETRGRRTWRDDLKHMPFSAHPLTEPDGTLWNFGSAPYAGDNGMLYIYRIQPKTGLEAVKAIELPLAAYLHSFAMTERYLVFYLGPNRYVPGGTTFVDSFEWSPELGSRVLLIDKNDLGRQRWFDAPPGFTFHTANAFERGDEVVVRLCLYPDATVMQEGMFGLMQGPSPANYPDYPRARLATLRLDLRRGRATVEDSDTLLEFPVTDPGQRHEDATVFGAGHAGSSSPAYSNAVVRIDGERVTRYAFPTHHIVEEPLFVPRENGRRRGGWLLGTFLDVDAAQTGVYVFDADTLDSGPIAMGRMHRSLPLGFHGCFVSA